MTNKKLQKRLMALNNVNLESRVNGLHKLLYDESLWFMAYQNIYSNKGAFTKGSDDSDTLDDFSKERINKIIASLKDMSYQCKPARRINIPKSNGKTRPLSIPCGTDKLVQEACRIILEAIYEPKFSDSSHGFRPGRSCHTTLQKVSTWTSTKWWIEFDIKGCFDNIDHTLLIKLLENRINDQKFIDIIRRFLKAGYIENFQYQNTFSGSPQGGIISPLLANIYLHELDKYVDDLCKLINNFEVNNFKNPEYSKLDSKYNACNERIKSYTFKYNRVKKYVEEKLNRMFPKEICAIFNECFELRKNKEYKTLYNRCVKLERLINLNCADLYEAFKIYEYKAKINENIEKAKEIYNLRKTLSSIKFNPEFERLRYVRYADDFILGFIGTKSRADDIYNQISTMLKDTLNLTISEEKSKVVFGSDGIIYLGYKIEMDEDKGSRVTRELSNGSKIIVKRNIGRPIFKVPIEKAIKFVDKRGYGSYVENTSKHRSYYQNFDEIEIIKQYNSELRGLIQYYKYAMNAKKIIGKVQWIWQYSLLKTLAAKHKCSVAQVFKNKIVKVKIDPLTKSKIWYVEHNDKHYNIFNIRNVEHVKMIYATNVDSNDIEFSWQINQRNSAVRKLIANECEICGKLDTDTRIILHHPNQIRNIPKNISEWERVKRMRLRKTIALCHECHMKTHHPN